MYQPGPTLTVNNARTALEAGLLAIGQGQAVIDFKHLTAADSAAVATLVAWRRAATARGASLRFANVPANLHSLATLYGVAELLDPGAADDAVARTDLPHH